MGGCSGVKEMSEGYNEAEFLVDFVTEAARQGRGGELAKYYAGSALAKENSATLDKYVNEKEELPAHIAAELQTKSATVTPWWWGLKTLIKVGRGAVNMAAQWSHLDHHGQVVLSVTVAHLVRILC